MNFSLHKMHVLSRVVKYFVVDVHYYLGLYSSLYSTGIHCNCISDL